MGVGERVIVGKRNFVEVVGSDELFGRGMGRTRASFHKIIILIFRY